ncbi:MAG: hypothetical protein ACRDG4_19220 [Chloroflexota bacterium]
MFPESAYFQTVRRRGRPLGRYPERRLLPTAGGSWQILFTLRVDKIPDTTIRDRMAVSLALIRGSLTKVQARGNTALHEGWLTGCTAIAEGGAAGRTDRMTRCFLLTDGQANEGLTDPEAIATQAADILSRTGLGTSTFGIGDYNEHLPPPLADHSSRRIRARVV